MAEVFHLKVSFGSRAGGQLARAKSNYIEREGRYEKDGEELEHKEHGNMPEWAQDDPGKYWEAADENERANGRLYSEVQFALPKELSEKARREQFVTDNSTPIVAAYGQMKPGDLHLNYPRKRGNSTSPKVAVLDRNCCPLSSECASTPATGKTQVAWGHDGKDYLSVQLPCHYTELMPGINWGYVDEIFTPAFWKYQSYMKRACCQYHNHRLGHSLMEEVSVCLLGGYGMPAELGLAAFVRLRDQHLLCGTASDEDIETALSSPFLISGKPRKYRFARQKARYLSATLSTLHKASPPEHPKELRDYLATLHGIGLKTASWVVRNHFGSDDVAILDVHIIRAGITVGLFDKKADPNQNYYDLEDRFLAFCRALEEPASLLDAIMWDYMRRIGPAAFANKQRRTQ